MKRITVSLPDELVDKIRRDAGDGQMSAYVARALVQYQERISLDELVAQWEEENPLSDEAKRRMDAELDAMGFVGRAEPEQRLAG